MIILYFALPSEVFVDGGKLNQNVVSKMHKGKNSSRLGRKTVFINQDILDFVRKNRSNGKVVDLLVPNRVTTKPSIFTKNEVKLFCRVGLFLHMDDNGTINGSLDHTSPYSKFFLPF